MPDILNFDETKVAALTAEIDNLEAKRKDQAKHIQDMMDAGESKAWDQAEHLKFREHREKHDWLQADIDRMKKEKDAMIVTKPVANADKVNKSSSLLRWLKQGDQGLDSHELKDQESYRESMHMGGRKSYVDPIFAAAVIPAGNTNVLDTTVVQDVIDGLDAFGGSLECFTVAMTADGNTISYPLYDDTDKRAVIAGEQSGKAPGTKSQQQVAEIGETTLNNFGTIPLEAYVRNTGFLDISLFMNEDVGWDVGAFVRRNLMRRMGRTIEEELTYGGIAYASNVRNFKVATIGNPRDNEPTGFVARAGDLTYTSADTLTGKTLIKWEDINNLIHSIDPGYLKGEMGLYGFPHKPGKVGFMVNWSTLGSIKNISDTQNRPIVIPSVQEGGLNMLFGYPIFVNYELLSNGFAAQYDRPIYFGNWGYMTARFSGAGFAIEEHYDSEVAVKNANRYLGRIRYDSDYIGTLTSNKAPAIKALVRNHD